MPLKSTRDAEFKLSFWIIHTHRPFYRIIRMELDPDTKQMQDDISKGMKEVEKNPLASRFANKYLAAESLDFSKKRSENMTWAIADENGDFILEDGQEARQVWEMVKNDPAPVPELDRKCPPLPPPPELAKAKLTAAS